MMRRRSRPVAFAVVGIGATLALTGCTAAPGLQEIGLPGSDVSGYPIRVRFDDALDLVPLASVKLDGVKVGVVDRVDLTAGFQAEVTIKIKSDVRLPASTGARVAQTSLLGEKYVQLVSGTTNSEARPGQPALTPGALIDSERTSAAVEVENILGAASMILNGGGIENLQEISVQLSKALDGREQTTKGLLRGLSESLATIDSRRTDITRAMAGTDRLAAQVATQRAMIDDALVALPQGVRALREQQRDLVRAMAALGNFGEVASSLIRKTSGDVLADLKLLDPILKEIAAAAPSFFSTLDTLLTYPFARNIYGGMAGDYAQLAGELDIDLASLAKTLLKPGPDLGDPNPPIECGQFGSNCRPTGSGGAKPRSEVGKPSDSTLGTDLLDQLGKAGQ